MRFLFGLGIGAFLTWSVFFGMSGVSYPLTYNEKAAIQGMRKARPDYTVIVIGYGQVPDHPGAESFFMRDDRVYLTYFKDKARHDKAIDELKLKLGAPCCGD